MRSILVMTALLLAACPLPTDPGADTGTSGDNSTSDGHSTATDTDSSGVTSTGDEPTASDVTSTTGDPSTTTGDPSTTGDEPCSPQPGFAMGPCRLAVDPAGPCNDDLLCVVTQEGSFCQPTCADCSAHLHDSCIEELSTLPVPTFDCFPANGCDLPCSDDDDCADPLICGFAFGDERICVWPSTNPVCPSAGAPGTAFGACKPGNVCDDGLTCAIGLAGTVCQPDCDPQVGCTCGGECTGVGCRLPCIVAVGCPGDMVCDPSLDGGTCVVWM